MKSKKQKKLLPILCNVVGTLILISIIVLLLPATLPRLAGGDAFSVVSGSMEPTISVGAVVFVQPVKAEEIAEGDIIAFYSGTSIITHRVVNNQTLEGKFITKGDANADVDINPVMYDRLIGKVWFHMPYLGRLLTQLTSNIGKLYLLLLAMCGILFHVLAGEMRKIM